MLITEVPKFTLTKKTSCAHFEYNSWHLRLSSSCLYLFLGYYHLESAIAINTSVLENIVKKELT